MVAVKIPSPQAYHPGRHVGILVVSYGSREAAIIDALSRSGYSPDLYIADKQKNPFNADRARKHVVIPDLNVKDITDFAGENKDKIDFGIATPEGPIIAGVRNRIEGLYGIPVICPTAEYAIEGSKIRQRYMIQECAPEANPRFKIFSCREPKEKIRNELDKWLDELGDQAAVKPDKPGFGKGVGVWGDHFTDRDQLWDHFLSIYESGDDVIVEEKIEGEEFSLQFVSNGRHLRRTPPVRDYKRRDDQDKGPNTGGMGAYKDAGNLLPFMQPIDNENAMGIGRRIFEKLRGNSTQDMRGVLYVSYICAKEGLKVIELNSRPGDPEWQTLVPLLDGDYVDLCYNMLQPRLGTVEFRPKAAVAVYKAPPAYAGKDTSFQGSIMIDLSQAQALQRAYRSNLMVYPGSVEEKDGKIFALNSRTVCTVGIGDGIEEARRISMAGTNAIRGTLWNRTDIASNDHIKRSIEHMKELRA